MSSANERISSLSPERRKLLEELKVRLENQSKVETNIHEEIKIDNSNGEIDFSIFFFSADSTRNIDDKYEYILKISKYADENNFKAIWTPERHFHKFGGLYPNPSVLSSAIAAVTSHCEVRAGSVVLPLHHPIRVAEEWAVVDNLSNGRAGIAFASGWHPADFVLNPHNYEKRKEVMFDSIELLKDLWKGETVTFRQDNSTDTTISIQPLPTRNIPIWVSSSGSSSTWKRAGEMGINILTALLNQDIKTLEENIQIYKEARSSKGFDPNGGLITVMLHTYIGKDIEEVKNQVREPFIEYLRMHMDLYNDSSIIKEMNVDPKEFSEQDKEALASFAFERYFHTSSLMGTKESCINMVENLRMIGVNEIACLIDFGVEEASVMNSLELLNDLTIDYSNNRVGSQ